MSLETSTAAPAATADAAPERAGATASVDGGAATETSAASAAAPETTDTEQPQTAPKPKPTPEHRTAPYRFSEMARENRELRESIARLEGRLEEATRARAPLTDAPTPASANQPVVLTPPDPNDRTKYPEGRYDPEYAADLADYKWEKKQQEKAASAAQESAKAEAEAAEQAGFERFKEKRELSRDAYEAFLEAQERGEDTSLLCGNAHKVFDAKDGPLAVPRGLMDRITAAENPLHVAEWFARNPEALGQVKSMRRDDAIGYIATLDFRIGVNLKRLAAAAKAPPADAPKPAPSPEALPTAPAGGGSPNEAPPEGDLVAYKAWRKRNFG